MIKSIFLSFLLTIIPLFSNATENTLYTGFKGGTYSKMGIELVQSCTNIKVDANTTQGSVSNISNILNDPVTDDGNRFAFVQDDILSVINNESKGIKMYEDIGELFSEEILILTNVKSKISSVKDLNGRRVATGQHGSGNRFTSEILKQVYRINWLSIDRTLEESVLLLLAGEIDAMIIVGGVPMTFLQEVAGHFSSKLIPISIEQNNILDKMYSNRITIPAGTYPWLIKSIDTYTVKTKLVSAMDVPANKIKEFITCLNQNLPTLKQVGHPKWKQVRPIK